MMQIYANEDELKDRLSCEAFEGVGVTVGVTVGVKVRLRKAPYLGSVTLSPSEASSKAARAAE